jgi:hypothetical protein
MVPGYKNGFLVGQETIGEAARSNGGSVNVARLGGGIFDPHHERNPTLVSPLHLEGSGCLARGREGGSDVATFDAEHSVMDTARN